jgi:DNA-directed RNA polymerase subunit RPC12/RpoP
MIRECPRCDMEGEADSSEAELECPHCGFTWTVEPAPSPERDPSI